MTTSVAQGKKDAEVIKTKDMERYKEESRGLERDYIGELVDGKRRGWIAAYVGWSVGLAGVFAGWAGLKQEAPPPVVFWADKETGHVEVMTVIRDSPVTYGEVTDRFFLNQYVLNRESYDYDTLRTLYHTTGLLSSGDEQHEYQKLFEGQEARDKKLTNQARILTKVKSITVNPIAPEATIGTATVRFTTQLVHKNGGPENPQHMIATVGYRYVRAPISEEDRRVNPYGFQVTSYRVDPEIITGSSTAN